MTSPYDNDLISLFTGYSQSLICGDSVRVLEPQHSLKWYVSENPVVCSSTVIMTAVTSIVHGVLEPDYHVSVCGCVTGGTYSG